MKKNVSWLRSYPIKPIRQLDFRVLLMADWAGFPTFNFTNLPVLLHS